jgi:hypothetical protein
MRPRLWMPVKAADASTIAMVPAGTCPNRHALAVLPALPPTAARLAAEVLVEPCEVPDGGAGGFGA